MPSYTLLHKEFTTESYNKYNQCFASDSESLIKEPVALWIYGHTHKENSSVINSVKLLCNPLGYPSERSNIDIREKLKKYIDVEIIQDNTFDKSTIIYLYNNKKIIYPEDAKFSTSAILRFFNIK
jgi:hypothetical protein